MSGNLLLNADSEWLRTTMLVTGFEPAEPNAALLNRQLSGGNDRVYALEQKVTTVVSTKGHCSAASEEGSVVLQMLRNAAFIYYVNTAPCVCISTRSVYTLFSLPTCSKGFFFTPTLLFYTFSFPILRFW